MRNENLLHRPDYVDHAVRHVMMRQGVLGVTVSIMLPHDPTVSAANALSSNMGALTMAMKVIF